MHLPFRFSLLACACALTAAAQTAAAPAAPPAAAVKPAPKTAVSKKAVPAKAAAPKAAAAKPAPAAKATPPKASPAVDPNDPVVASAGDIKIKKSEFENFVAGLPDYLKSMSIGPAKKNLVKQMLDVYEVAHEARALKYDNDPKVRAQLAFQTEQALASSYLNAEMQKVLGDEKYIRDYYDRNIGVYKQVQARHILIRIPGSVVQLREGQKEMTEAEAFAKAQDLRKRIVAGEDFAALAKAESDDVGSGARGGDLGFFSAGQMVPQFEQAAFALEKNQVSEPVKSQFGFHVIQVLDTKQRAFDEVKAEIKEKSGPELRSKIMEELRKKYPVTIDEEYFAK